MEMELKVLTLNAWGLFVGGKFIKERIAAIGDELPEYDIACLQEVWSREDYDDLISQVSSKMPYSHHFKTGIIGSGLCIFSKYPIVSAIGHEYRVSVGMRRFHNGEVFAGKGVLCCKIKTQQGIIAVFTTHLSGGRKQSHIFELMQFVRHIRGNHPVIITGDFNTEEKHTAYQLITKCLGLNDAFKDESGANTCDLPGNCFAHASSRPKRIDFVFYSDHESPGNFRLRLMSREVVLTENIPGKDYPYSDHAGIEAVFKLVETEGDSNDQTHYNMKMDDPALNVLRKISAELTEQMNKLHKSDVHKNGKFIVPSLVGFIVVAYLLLATLNEVFSDYHIQWFTMPLLAIIGALTMAYLFFTLNEIQLCSGMTANIDEINTILQYHENNRNADTYINFS